MASKLPRVPTTKKACAFARLTRTWAGRRGSMVSGARQAGSLARIVHIMCQKRKQYFHWQAGDRNMPYFRRCHLARFGIPLMVLCVFSCHPSDHLSLTVQRESLQISQQDCARALSTDLTARCSRATPHPALSAAHCSRINPPPSNRCPS